MFGVKRCPLPTAALGAMSLLLAISALVAGSGRHAAAQSAQSGITFQDLGSQKVTGTDWNFSADFAISAGAWESITIANYGYCFVGPNDPRAGTAHAGGVFWYTVLQPQAPGAVDTYTGDLKPARGGNVSGHVTVTTTPGATPDTHVDVTLSGSDLNFYQDNSLEVCLLGSS